MIIPGNIQGLGTGIIKQMQNSGLNPAELPKPNITSELSKAGLAAPETGSVSGVRAPSFPEMVGDFVGAVDAKSKASVANARAIMTGESDNLHQAVISSQESGVAFSLMVEVRNKLMESYQELMRMQV